MPEELKAADAPDPQQAVLRLIAAKWISQAVSVCAELGIADILKNGPQSPTEIATVAGASEHAVFRLCRALASLGLLSTEGQRFALTESGQYLRSDVPGSLRGLARFFGHDATWRPWGKLAYSVRTGKPAFDHVFGVPIFEHLSRDVEAAAIFNEAMTSVSTIDAKAVVDAYDFSGIRTLVDVGGGYGLLLATALTANPNMRGVLFELPHAIDGAATLLKREGVANRCELRSGDFFQFAPEGGDAYALKRVIHDWDDDRALQILRNCHRAMRASGRLLVIDRVIRPGDEPDSAKLLDLEMLVLTSGGRERSEPEFHELFAKAGFLLTQVVPTAVAMSVIEGVKQ